MCGFVGVLSTGGLTNRLKRKAIMEDLLVMSQVRGRHGTGLLTAGGLTKSNKDTSFNLYKRALNSTDYLQLDRAKKLLDGMDGFAFTVGHTRHATSGSHTDDFTHPYHFPTLIGFHNGTLDHGYHSLSKGNYGNDSQTLYAALDDCSTVEEQEVLLGKVSGAFALWWFDKDNGELHFIRNDERPMWFGFVKGEDTIIFASESWMIQGAAGRNGAVLEEVVSVETGLLHTFNTTKIKEFVTSKVTLEEPFTRYPAYDKGFGSRYSSKRAKLYQTTALAKLVSASYNCMRFEIDDDLMGKVVAIYWSPGSKLGANWADYVIGQSYLITYNDTYTYTDRVPTTAVDALHAIKKEIARV